MPQTAAGPDNVVRRRRRRRDIRIRIGRSSSAAGIGQAVGGAEGDGQGQGAARGAPFIAVLMAAGMLNKFPPRQQPTSSPCLARWHRDFRVARSPSSLEPWACVAGRRMTSEGPENQPSAPSDWLPLAVSARLGLLHPPRMHSRAVARSPDGQLHSAGPLTSPLSVGAFVPCHWIPGFLCAGKGTSSAEQQQQHLTNRRPNKLRRDGRALPAVSASRLLSALFPRRACCSARNSNELRAISADAIRCASVLFGGPFWPQAMMQCRLPRNVGR